MARRVCNPQALPITGCLGDVITRLFRRQTQGVNKLRQGTISPQMHLRYTTLISLGLPLGGTVEVATVGGTQNQDSWGQLHLHLLL